MDNIIILFSTILLVFMRALQQQNVIHRYYWWAAFTSYLIAIGEVAVVYNVAQVGWTAVPYVGTGGALGVTLSMYAHNRWIKK
jgi:hypothetical protein